MSLVRNYRVTIAIIIFVFAFTAIHMIKPGFAYRENGGFRQFGLGYRHKTVIPVWVIAIVLAIFSYMIALVI